MFYFILFYFFNSFVYGLQSIERTESLFVFFIREI